jgi:SAM-dependent methyltransferase
MAVESPRHAVRTDAKSTYFTAIIREGLWPSEPALRRYVSWLFRGVSLDEKRILDVGGGTGVFSFYAAAMGAADVICLEPESDGGTEGMSQRYRRLRIATGFENVRMVTDTFQNFEAPPGAFDLVLLHNSINHLDEVAAIQLRRDVPSREVYRLLFRKLSSLVAPGGDVLITDCARTNFFPLLHIPHPISRSIEWHKHQDPGLWAKMLQEAGFTSAAVGWSSYNSFGRLGWDLLANRVGAFFLTGHFRLLMRKQSIGPQP